jgi:hypothetical protein
MMVIESPFFAAPKGEGCGWQIYFECPGDISLRSNGRVEAVRDGSLFLLQRSNCSGAIDRLDRDLDWIAVLNRIENEAVLPP